MFIVHSYPAAIAMCIITMICWGSWANTTKLVDAKRWPFQLFYWDYTIGIVLFALVLALTMGSMGTEGRPFLTDLMQASVRSICYALLGGVIFNLSNILLVAAIDLAGMAVAFPIGVGLALVLGVITNYMGNPQGNATILFIGVGCVTVAIILTALAYSRIKSDDKSGKLKGVITALLAGIIMGWFFRFVAMSMSADFVKPGVGLMTPYTALVIFSIGIFLSNFIWNIAVMKKPIAGEPVEMDAYFKGTFKEHAVGILGGVIWCLGMGFSLIASGKAGYAVSYGLGQGATMVAVIWGVFIWREFKGAPVGTNKLLAIVFASYILGIALIILAN